MSQLGLVPGAASGMPAAAPSVLRDEQQLRQAYDQHVDALVSAAIHKLGDAAHLAPRVVEAAFVAVWHGRAEVPSEVALAGTLMAEVDHAVARALSRRLAAHRLGHHGMGSGPHRASGHARPDGSFDRETSWAHILHGARADVANAEAHAKAAQIAHHDAAVHIAELSKSGSWVKPVVVGVVTVGLGLGGIWLMDAMSHGTRIEMAVAAPTARTVAALAGQLGSVTLAEGTQVRIAPQSEIRIPDGFGPDLRGVGVVGAARFEVARGIDRPLVVMAGGAKVEATGTAFTVRAYPGDGGATIVLHEGSVDVTGADGSRHALLPGDGLFAPDSVAPRAPTEGQLAEAVSWTENTYVAHDRRLGDVLVDLERWYRTKIFTADPAILERRITLRAPLDSVRQAIEAIESGANVQFGYISDKMVFTDRAASAARKPR